MPLRWFLALVSAAALALSFLYAPGAFPALQLCWFRRWTGVSCPGCGLTRSFCALSHGDLAAAWSYHPFGIVFYAAAVALVAAPFLARGEELERRLLRSRGVGGTVVAFVVALVVFGVVRAWGEVHAR